MNRIKQIIQEEIEKFQKPPKPSLGPKTYVKASDIPPQIIAWAKSIVGSGFQNKITVQKSNGWVRIDMPWHEADRETHQYFKLTDTGAAEMGDPVSRSGWGEVNMGDNYGNTPIPSGYVLATVGTYPKRLEIVTNTDAMEMLSDNSSTINKLSDDEIVALHQAVSLKSAYRQKFDVSVYQKLASLGLLNSQKAVTIDGRNIANSPEAKERLREIKKKDQEENGWNKKYEISNV